jgi:hypothetical protein
VTEVDRYTDERARPWSRRSPQTFAKLARQRIAPFRTGALLATFHDAPAPRVVLRI